ncbi:MAG: hypothetical protein Q4C13_05040 [Clostridia bacterium]|nr:hypothetical protein [Clostridia bacterium]
MTRSLKDFQPGNEEAQIREAIQARSGLSENELLSELEEVTRMEREAGRMDNLVMDEIYDKLSPMLSDKQREKMREVLERLRA